MKQFAFLLVIASLTLGGCASRDATEQQAQAEQNQQSEYHDPRDPLEPFNRTMWDFNYDVLDKYLLRPVTVAYVDYMPQFARTGLLNAADNLAEPANAVNNLLQGKIEDTFVSLGRFLLNSTIGLLGTIDVADEIGLQEKSEDFGQTLGTWGVDTGPYLMIPARGPSDVRSTGGDIVDSSYFPLADLTIYVSVLRWGIKALEARANLIEQEQQLATSSDQYLFVKDAYFQNLEFKVKDGEVEIDDSELEMDEDFEDLLDDL